MASKYWAIPIVIFIAVGIIVFTGSIKFQVIGGTAFNIVQYYGTPQDASSGGWLAWAKANSQTPDEANFNTNDIQILDYTIHMEKYDRYTIGGCKGSSWSDSNLYNYGCQGTGSYCGKSPFQNQGITKTTTDEFGCVINTFSYLSGWKGTCSGNDPCGNKVCQCYTYNCGKDYPCIDYTKGTPRSISVGGFNTNTRGNEKCGYKYQIFKNGQLVTESPNMWLSNQTTFRYDDLTIYLNAWQEYGQSSCYSIENDYTVKIPNDAFAVNISAIKQQYISGENATVSVTIQNNWRALSTSTVTLHICQPVWYGVACGDVTKSFSIAKGQNEYYFDIPTNLVAEKMIITPTITIKGSYSDFNMHGVNYNCIGGSNIDPIELCQNIVIGTYTAPETTIMIIPKPVFIEQDCNNPSIGCPIDYQCIQTIDGRIGCANKDVLGLKLGCQILGCPVVQGSVYSCTSSGICAEQIFTPIDCRHKPDMCGAGMSCVESSDKTFAYCLKTELVGIVQQCIADSDCKSPCNGVTAHCNAGICDYSGSCEVIQVGCKELGCSEGYTCNKAKNVCEKETTNVIEKTVIQNQTIIVPKTVTVIQPMPILQDIKNFIFAVAPFIIILLIITIAIIWIRK